MTESPPGKSPEPLGCDARIRQHRVDIINPIRHVHRGFLEVSGVEESSDKVRVHNLEFSFSGDFAVGLDVLGVDWGREDQGGHEARGDEEERSSHHVSD